MMARMEMNYNLEKKKISQIFQVNSCALKNDPNCNYHHCVVFSLNNFLCQLISAIKNSEYDTKMTDNT